MKCTGKRSFLYEKTNKLQASSRWGCDRMGSNRKICRCEGDTGPGRPHAHAHTEITKNGPQVFEPTRSERPTGASASLVAHLPFTQWFSKWSASSTFDRNFLALEKKTEIRAGGRENDFKLMVSSFFFEMSVINHMDSSHFNG